MSTNQATPRTPQAQDLRTEEETTSISTTTLDHLEEIRPVNLFRSRGILQEIPQTVPDLDQQMTEVRKAFLRTNERIPRSPLGTGTISSPPGSSTPSLTSSVNEPTCGTPFTKSPQIEDEDLRLLLNTIDDCQPRSPTHGGTPSRDNTRLSSMGRTPSLTRLCPSPKRAETINPPHPISTSMTSSTTTISAPRTSTTLIISESDSEEEQEANERRRTSTPPPPPSGKTGISQVHSRILTKQTRIDKVVERDRDLFEREEEYQRKRKQQSQDKPKRAFKKDKPPRWNFKKFFLTYPHCPLTTTEAMDQIEAILAGNSRLKEGIKLSFAMVAQEQHKDGSPHLHAVLAFDRAKNIKDPRYFDLVSSDPNCNNNSQLIHHHPNIQKVKNLRSSVNYLKKFDPNPLIKGTMPENEERSEATESSSTSDSNKRKSKGVTNEVSLAVQQGSTFQTLLTKYPGFAMMNKSKIDDLAAFVQYSKAMQDVEPWAPLLYSGSHEPTKQLVDWVNANLFTSRPFKSPQLFVSGAPNSRKTSFAQLISRRARTYYAAHDRYFDHFDENLYDLVVFDEFNARDRDKAVILSFLDGQACRLTCRYKNTFKTKNLPVILLTNEGVDIQYVGDSTARDAMRARLLEVSLGKGEVIDMENVNFSS